MKAKASELEKESILLVIGVIETVCKTLVALIPILKGMVK